MQYWTAEEEELEGKMKYLIEGYNTQPFGSQRAMGSPSFFTGWFAFHRRNINTIREINNFDGIRVKTFKEMAEVGREYLKNIYNDREEANTGIS